MERCCFPRARRRRQLVVKVSELDPDRIWTQDSRRTMTNGSLRRMLTPAATSLAKTLRCPIPVRFEPTHLV